MKIKLKRLFLLSLVLLVSSALFAQNKKGQIGGFVRDAQTGDALPFAYVIFQGTNIGTNTDDKGFYQLKGINAGDYKMKISFIGYADTFLVVSIDENSNIVKDITLSFGSTLSEIVITAQAVGQVKAINNQISSRTIKNVVSEAKIRELPDANAAEALARLPGVSVGRDNGEATSVRIRGLSSNTVYVNGMRMEGGLGSVSPTMIGAIEVSKAFMPDQDADVVGGSVDFKMREAAPGFKKEISFRQGYNNLNKSFKMIDASLLLSNRFFNDKLGVMASFSYDKKNRSRDSYYVNYRRYDSGLPITKDYYEVRPIAITEVGLRRNENINDRYGVTIYSDYKFSFGKIYYQGFYSSLRGNNLELTNAYNSNLQYIARGNNKTEGNIMNGMGGELAIGVFKIDFGASISNRIEDNPNQLDFYSTNYNGMGTLLVTDSTTLSEFLGAAKHDINITDMDGLYATISKKTHEEVGYKVNVEAPFRFGNFIDGFLKFGVKARSIKREYNLTQTCGELVGYSDQLFGYIIDDASPEFGLRANMHKEKANWILSRPFLLEPYESDFTLLDNKLYFLPDLDKIRRAIAPVADQMYQKLPPRKDDYSNTEDLFAGYVMAGLNFGKMVTLTPGVRYEKNTYSTTARNTVISNDLGSLAAQGTIFKVTQRGNNTNLFPMIHLKIKPVKWFDIRLAYTETVTRPPFEYLSPKYYQLQVGDVEVGNPKLKPQLNTNYDIYLSFYSSKLGLFTAGAFYKSIANEVNNYIANMIDPLIYGLPQGGIFSNKKFTQPINMPKTGFIRGVEFDWQTQFGYLPKPFNGIILNANISFMESRAYYPFYETRPVFLVPAVWPFRKNEAKDSYSQNKMRGMPDMVGNVSLGYELGGFSGRVSIYAQDKTFGDLNDPNNGSLNTEVKPFQRVDIQISQKFKRVEGLAIYLNISNLTNSHDVRDIVYHPLSYTSSEGYGASADLGVRYKF